MNVQVNVEHLKYIGFDMYDISRQLSQLSSELGEAERLLKKQTEFSSSLRALKSVRDDMELEKHHMNILSQTLVNVGSEYRRTERKIEDNFELQKPEYTWMDVGKVNLTKLYKRATQLLYGGETEWQR